MATKMVQLDGSEGEGGGQILRTALSLSLITGESFQIKRIRANRDKPGLRPQHLTAVEAAALLGDAEVRGGSVGSRELTFRPEAIRPRDLTIDIGTAGSTALVLHTLHLPLALSCSQPTQLTLTGGTFNLAAPSYPYLKTTWQEHMKAIGLPIDLASPRAGFYPRGGGVLEATIVPAKPLPLVLIDRGRLVRVRLVAGVAGLTQSICERMLEHSYQNIVDRNLADEVEISRESVSWHSSSPGAAFALIADYEAGVPACFVGLGERGKRSETVVDEALDEFFAHDAAVHGAVDSHAADQILVTLAIAQGPSQYSTSKVTEHLRTNVKTINRFLNRTIQLDEEEGIVRIE